MRISYLFNSSLPSSNPGSIQVANMCSAMTELSHDVNIIVPKTDWIFQFQNFMIKNSKLNKLIFLKNFL